MKNYFEHDVRVEYIEGLLNHSQDWEWFVRYIEENYDLEDISSWDEYRSKNNSLQSPYPSKTMKKGNSLEVPSFGTPSGVRTI